MAIDDVSKVSAPLPVRATSPATPSDARADATASAATPPAAGDSVQVSRDAQSATRAKPHGLTHLVHQVEHAMKDVGVGAGDEAFDQGSDIVNVARHPVDTAKGFSRLFTHPVKSIEALGKAHEGGKDEGMAKHIGRIVADLGIGYVSAGGGPAAHALGAVSTISGYVGPASTLADAGNGSEDVRDDPHGPKLSSVVKGFADDTIEPAKDFAHMAEHPKETAEDLASAVRHPRSTFKHFDQSSAGESDGDNGRAFGRGLFRLGTMAAGFAIPRAMGKLGKAEAPLQNVESKASMVEDVARAGKAVRAELTPED